MDFPLLGSNPELNRVQQAIAADFRRLQTAIGSTVTAALTFPVIASGGNASLTIAAPGVAAGGPIVFGAPSTLAAGLVPVAFASAPGTVTVRLHNITGSSSVAFTETWTVRTFGA